MSHKRFAAAQSGRRSIPSDRGDLYLLLAGEHAHLDELLTEAAGDKRSIDKAAYSRFRERLLRHIRIEERILLPMAQRKRGEPLPIAARLRLDHGALAALLMLPPAERTFRAIRAVLDTHNPLEEAQGGVYDQCQHLAASETGEVLAQIAATPRVPASPWVDSPKVMEAAKRVLERAGYNPALLGSGDREFG